MPLASKPPEKTTGRAPQSETRQGSGAVADFIAKVGAMSAARTAGNPSAGAGRLLFALDATMSRQPTWDLACQLQAEMFETVADTGGLNVQLIYFRGFGECKASKWVSDARALAGLMTGIDCRGGHTQISKVFSHVRDETKKERINAIVYVGDAMEEDIDRLAQKAGEIGLLGCPMFFFQEGHDPTAESAFREFARLSKGAYAKFDASAPRELAALLRAVAAYASGGRAALKLQTSAPAQKLLEQLR